MSATTRAAVASQPGDPGQAVDPGQPGDPGQATSAAASTDAELKARHRAMWAAGDYPAMVETFLRPLGQALVDACGVDSSTTVLDVACGSGNAALAAARARAAVTASDLTPELLDAGQRQADAEGLWLDWVQADAERLPFPDESFDVVMSSIGAMFAPHHGAVADELVRVCRRGGTIALLSWTPDGMVGALLRTLAPFAPPPPPGAQPPPLWGDERHLRELFGARVSFETIARDVLAVDAFAHPQALWAHFRTLYGPTIAAVANAERDGRAAALDAAMEAFCAEWDRGAPGRARFDMEYLLALGTRA